MDLLINQEQPDNFNVDLDGHWQEWGYSTKQKAVQYLTRNFREDQDFILTIGKDKMGRADRHIYLLTEETAFAMQKRIQTGKMKEYRERIMDASATAIQRVQDLSGAELVSAGLNRLLDENSTLIDANETLHRTLKELEPKAAAYDNFLSAVNDRLLSLVARDLGLRPRKLQDALVADGVLFYLRDCTIAKQEYVDRGYFVHKTRSGTLLKKFRLNNTHVYVTPRGQAWLSDRYEDREDLFAYRRKALADRTRNALVPPDTENESSEA